MQPAESSMVAAARQAGQLSWSRQEFTEGPECDAIPTPASPSCTRSYMHRGLIQSMILGLALSS